MNSVINTNNFIEQAKSDLGHYSFSLDSNGNPINLGAGGIGSVFLGYSNRKSLAGYRYAIKCLKNQHLQREDIRTKFILEGQIYLGLKHPYIVKLKDFIGATSQTNYRTYLVLEYVNGKDLGHWMKKSWGINKPIPIENAVFLMSQILEGIKHAHNSKINIKGYNGVLHLDIKPGNILITPNGVKIIDFGISQGSSQRRSKRVMGSLPYMAPEQFNTEKKLDKRTDVYALGVLFNEMITGLKWDRVHIKFNGNQDNYKNNVREWILNKPFPSLPDSCYNPIIDELIQKATQKNPDHRFQSCEEIISEINKLF